MKLSSRLQMYRDEVKRSKRWRTDNSYDADWKRYIDLYAGKHYTGDDPNDRLIVNLVFSTVNVMAPSVAVNNPRFVVNAREIGKAPNAIVTEEILNYLWRVNKYQDEFRLAVNDSIVCGHGWVKCGYKWVKPVEEKKASDDAADPHAEGSEVGLDDREDVDGNVESEMNVTDDRPFVERISPFDMFVDPDARHPKEMAWIAQRIWRPLQDVQVDSRYSATARKKVSGKSWSRWTANDGDGDARDDKPNKGPRTFVEVVEFYDIKRGTVCTFSMDAEDTEGESAFLIKPHRMPYAMGQPFEMVRNYEVADHFYPMGDVAQIESLQLELNQTRTQMMNHRKRFQRKWLYERDAFDKEGVAALESDVDNTMIPVMTDGGNPSQAIAPLPAVITPSEFYDQSSLITNDIDRVSGVSDYQRGASQTAVKRTATEAAMIQDAANARAQDRLARIESSLSRIGERIIGLMQQFLTGEHVARIVTMPGRQWVNYDVDYIQGKFDFEVAAGSTEPMNETFRRQSALQLVDASMPFLEMGVANPTTLYMHILQKGFGIKDVSNFVVQPQGGPPPPDPDTAMPQDVPIPGQPQQMPPQPMPPQGMPPEQQLTEPTMDQGMGIPEGIDPAMLMQLMGSNAGPM